MDRFGDFDLDQIKEDVVSLCNEMGLPLREVYVSADFQEEVYQVEVELFKDYESLEDQLREEIEIEERLKESYGNLLSVNIICVEED